MATSKTAKPASKTVKATSRASAPRRRLDHEQVVAAAEALVDELGWDNLTMAALAAKVQTKAPSLYNHVASLEVLRSELQQSTMRDLGRELVTATMGRAGRDSFFAIAQAFRSFVLRYPHRYEGTIRAPIDREAFAEASQDAGHALAAVVRSYGVDEANMYLAQGGVFAALHGVVSLETAGFFGDNADHDALFETVVAATEQQLALLAGDRAA